MHAVLRSLPQTMHPSVARLFERANIQQHTEEWYDRRGKMLTASDVATTINLNPYKSRARLLLQKLVQQPPSFVDGHAELRDLVEPAVRAVAEGGGSSFMTAYGNEMEDVAARRYEEVSGKKCLSFGLFTHLRHEWLGASPDRVTQDDGTLVEIKCPVRRTITPEVPDYYYPQIQVLLEVLDLERCDFVQFRPEATWTAEELVVTTVPRDREWFARHLPAMRAFYDDWMAIRGDPDEYLAFVRDHTPRKRRAREPPAAPEGDVECPFLETKMCEPIEGQSHGVFTIYHENGTVARTR